MFLTLTAGVHEHHQQGAQVQGAGAHPDGAAPAGQHVRQGSILYVSISAQKIFYPQILTKF
jgi:hypothetical protein